MAPRISKVMLSSGLAVSFASSGGRSAPALLMLPGPTDSWRSYAAVLDELPSSMRSIAVSQRGHGDTDKPPTGYRVEDFAYDVPLLLDALGIDRAVIAGHWARVWSPAMWPSTVLSASPGWCSKPHRHLWSPMAAYSTQHRR